MFKKRDAGEFRRLPFGWLAASDASMLCVTIQKLIHGCVIHMAMLLLVIHDRLPESSFLMLQDFLVPSRGW